jgi:DNA-binding MarR family transcriptional regulator
MSDAPPLPFYTAETLEPGNSIGLLMKRVLQSVLQQVDRALQPHDLTHAQWIPLYWLARGAGSTPAELARDAALDPGAMTRALDRLEAKGLISRTRSCQDRRVVQIELTDAGRAAADRVPAVLSDVLNGHLRGFSDAEWRQLIGLLQRMVANGAALRDAKEAA